MLDMTQKPPKIQYLYAEQVAEELEVPITTVRHWIQKKRLTAYKFGKKLKIRREDLDEFIKESRTN